MTKLNSRSSPSIRQIGMAVLCPDQAHEFSVNQRLTDFRSGHRP
jgi:hypothetical protein